MLGPRPYPNQIRFSPDCFEPSGTRTEFIVLQSPLHSGPAVFTEERDAVEFAKRANRGVIRREVPVLRRVKWF